MGRDKKEQILILKTYKVGENHRGVKLLTPENGVISALVYGGNGKNSFKKGAILPFCFGQGDLIHDSVHDRYQLKEFAVQSSFDGVREDLKKMYMASLWFEIIMGSYGGGHQGWELFSLVLDSLNLLGHCDKEVVYDRIMVWFLWSYLELSGERPDPYHCCHCGKSLEKGLFRDRRGLLYCHNCASGGLGRLPSAIVPYLKRVDEVDESTFINIGIPRENMDQLRRWLYVVIQDHMEFPLRTLKTGSFVLG